MTQFEGANGNVIEAMFVPGLFNKLGTLFELGFNPASHS
jgi:hypothetical protein